MGVPTFNINAWLLANTFEAKLWRQTCFPHVPNSRVSIYLAVCIYVYKYACDGSSYDIRRIKPLKHCIFHASKPDLSDFLQRRSNNKIPVPFTNREEDVSWIWKRNHWTVVMSQHLWDHVWKDKLPFNQLFSVNQIPSSGLCPRALGEGGLHWLLSGMEQEITVIIPESLDIIRVNHPTWLKSNGKRSRIVGVSLEPWLCGSDLLPMVARVDLVVHHQHGAIGRCDDDILPRATGAQSDQRSLE